MIIQVLVNPTSGEELPANQCNIKKIMTDEGLLFLYKM